MAFLWYHHLTENLTLTKPNHIYIFNVTFKTSKCNNVQISLRNNLNVFNCCSKKTIRHEIFCQLKMIIQIHNFLCMASSTSSQQEVQKQAHKHNIKKPSNSNKMLQYKWITILIKSSFHWKLCLDWKAPIDFFLLLLFLYQK